jgi:hypothetical protein
MPFYRNILKEALKISWKNKFLWFFGLFAVLLGSGGEYEIITNSLNTGQFFSGISSLFSSGLFRVQSISNFIRIIQVDPVSMLIMIGIIAILGMLSLFLFWLTVVSQLSIVYAVSRLYNGKEANFQDCINFGIKRFWPGFWLNVISKALIYIVIIIMLGLFKIFVFPSALARFPVVLLALAFGIMLSFAMKYALAVMAIKGEPAIISIRSGFKLFWANRIISIETAFILFFINLFAAFSALFIVMMLVNPFYYFSWLANQAFGSAGLIIGVLLSVVLSVCIIAFIGLMSTILQIGAWTILYSELASGGAASKLSRLFKRNV